MSATEIEQPTAGPYVAFSPLSNHQPSEKVVSSANEVAVGIEQTSESAPVGESDKNESSQSKTLDFSSEPLPAPPVFQDKYKEREYLKSRLTLAFRVFAKLGFDCGIAGHITLRVSLLLFPTDTRPLTKHQGSCRPFKFLAQSFRQTVASSRDERLDPGRPTRKCGGAWRVQDTQQGCIYDSSCW